MNINENGGALSGLSVVEIGSLVAAPFCGKLLADLGADVVKIEPPGTGDPARRRGPFPNDEPHPERSGLFLYLNTSKRSVTLDPFDEANEDDIRILRELIAGADVFIEDTAPGTLERLGLAYADLARTNPGLVMTSITPFGQTGPNRDLRGHPLNCYHVGGHTAFHLPEGAELRPPAKAAGYLGEYDAGLVAAVGTLGALAGRRGRHVDISKQEAMMGVERVEIAIMANDPNPNRKVPSIGGMMTAKDGYLLVTPLENHQWHGLVRAMGDPEWAQADWCENELGRSQHAAEISPRIEAWAAGLTRDEIYHRCQTEGTPAGPIRNTAEVSAWEQAQARGFFVELDHPEAGVQRYPTAAYRLSRTPWCGRRAPLLGEHNAEVRRSLATPATSKATAKPSQHAADVDPQAPLAGVRVVDFTWAWAGPQSTLLLAMLGAEVIKVESRTRLDHARVRSIQAGAMHQGPDASTIFNDLNLGKRSLTLNLRTPEAREIVRRLVAESDVVTQNMRPGVLDRLGLGYDDLRRVKPDIVMLSASAVGGTGPEKFYGGYAPTFASLSGVADLTGYPDQQPIPLSGSVDLRVGTTSALAVLAALHHRERTGEGQHIDLSSTEVMSAMIGDAFLEYSLCGRVPERNGNRDPIMEPHSCYRCADDPDAGESDEARWLSIAVDTEDEWAALRTVIADPELEDTAFATPAGRRRERDRLDTAIERWTREREPAAAVEILQRAGVYALPVQTSRSLSQDPHIRERGVLTRVTHPVVGERIVVGPPWKLAGAAVRGPAPLIGQHTEAVLSEILGMSREEIEQLAATGALD